MNRPVATLGFCILAILCFVSIATEQVRDFSVEKQAVNISATFLLAFGAVFYCGFAAIHAVQHIANPSERAAWLIIIIACTAMGSLFYLLTKYQHFREIGKGSLIRDRRKMRFSEFLRLTEDEKAKNA